MIRINDIKWQRIKPCCYGFHWPLKIKGSIMKYVDDSVFERMKYNEIQKNPDRFCETANASLIVCLAKALYLVL